MRGGRADHHDDRISPEQLNSRRRRLGTEEDVFMTRRVEDVDHNFGSFGIFEGRARRRILSEQPWHPDKSDAGKAGPAIFFLAMPDLQLGYHLAHDGRWRQTKQPCDVIELFSTDAPVSLAV